VHHVELWVEDLDASSSTLGWLLEALGWAPFQSWSAGRSWRLGDTYVVLEQSPALVPGPHDRTRAGLNHLALHAGSRADVDRVTREAQEHGWSTLFGELHPHAGGPEHYAAYLEDDQGFEVELVADGAEPAADGSG
jgi:catechol 2,3-dioxygenase-like lactoylglutathione lyase family enzyme